jgi:hypothetical protein
MATVTERDRRPSVFIAGMTPIADSARPAVAPDLPCVERRSTSPAARAAGQSPQHRAGEGGKE